LSFCSGCTLQVLAALRAFRFHPAAGERWNIFQQKLTTELHGEIKELRREALCNSNLFSAKLCGKKMPFRTTFYPSVTLALASFTG
jgi:hypothetical protein